MFDTAKILVVDDDPHVRETIRMALHDAGMDVSVAGNGSEGLAHFIVRPSDLIVLDVGMPGMDGLEMCRRIRRSSNVPILFLSARNEEIDRILGLEIGGDDYVVKPFSPRELIARIKAILKRDGSHFQGDAAEPLRHGDLSLDPTAHRAAFNGRPVGLTALEFGILRGLMSRPGVVFRRHQIVAMAYGPNMHISDRTVDSHIRNIRAKLHDAGCGNSIETVHGVGFRLGPCTAG